MKSIENDSEAQAFFADACSSGNFAYSAKNESPSFTLLLDSGFVPQKSIIQNGDTLLHIALKPWPKNLPARLSIIKRLLELDFSPARPNIHEVSCLEIARAKLMLEQSCSGIKSKRCLRLKKVIDLFEQSILAHRSNTL
jgi:hypothetical protein